MSLEKLSKFLVKAKINTYASSGEGGEKVLPDGSKEFEFREGKFKYRDRYFGFYPFIGEEIVWQDENSVWGMNYFGFILADDLTEKKLGSFLQKSLMQGYNDIIPVRGPREFSENNWTYKLSMDGNLSRFTGQEEILRDEKVVYRLFLHGGFIKKYEETSKTKTAENL